MQKKIGLNILFLLSSLTYIISCSSGGDSSSSSQQNDVAYKFLACSDNTQELYFDQTQFDQNYGSPNTSSNLNWGSDDGCYFFDSAITQSATNLSISEVSSINNFEGCDCNGVSNLIVNVTIQGQDNENEYGDGSGVFFGSASADNAVNYGFRIGNTGDETQNSDGNFSFTLTEQGLNQFPFYIYAYSEDGTSISKIINLSIYVEGNGGSGNNDVLVWFDDFDGTGPIDSSKWTTETGGGGWGNQEVQIYTSSSNNVRREAGILKIKVIKGSDGNFTSARIKTQDKFEFKYGRVEIRAKLPSVQGSWPALWMLGANYPEVGWPQCGEIDIMEQFQNKSKVQSTLHWKLANGNRAEYGLDVTNATSTDFHVYAMEWTPSSIRTYLDGNEFFSMNINGAGPYFPFNEDFFFIFNVAMGGTNGGEIDPNLNEGYIDAMEVDYVRVYQ